MKPCFFVDEGREDEQCQVVGIDGDGSDAGVTGRFAGDVGAAQGLGRLEQSDAVAAVEKFV